MGPHLLNSYLYLIFKLLLHNEFFKKKKKVFLLLLTEFKFGAKTHF